MKETVINYIEDNIAYARENRGTPLVDVFMAHAFGALQLYCRLVFEKNPGEENDMIYRWNNGWRLEFEHLRYLNP